MTSEINLKFAEAIKDNRESIINALNDIASGDEDFNGNNGENYLWEEAKKQDFKSNMEYVGNTIKDSATQEEIICEYLNNWLGRDSYYENYNWEIVEYPNKDSILIIVAYTTNN